MTDTNYKSSLSLVLAHEGGFTNNPKDPGGATNKGVTQAVYDAYRRNKSLPTQSVRLISNTELNDIYKQQYWIVAGCNLLPSGIDYAVFDYAVNSGPGRAIKDLQRTINDVGKEMGLSVGVDSDFGQQTLDGANRCNNAAFIEAYCARRMKFLRSLKTFADFGNGWTRRVLGDKPNPTADEGDNGVVDYAVKMLNDEISKPVKAAELPTPIGEKPGEVAAKAPEADKAVTKTPEGVGAVAAGIGVTGATVFQAADAVKPHIDNSVIGRIAAIVFGLLMLAGVCLVVYTFLRKRREQAA